MCKEMDDSRIMVAISRAKLALCRCELEDVHEALDTIEAIILQDQDEAPQAPASPVAATKHGATGLAGEAPFGSLRSMQT